MIFPLRKFWTCECNLYPQPDKPNSDWARVQAAKAALSNPPAAVESNASAEARLRVKTTDGFEVETLQSGRITKIISGPDSEALSPGGDEAKKSEGGTFTNCASCDMPRTCLDHGRCFGPSDPPDRREIKLTEAEWRNVDDLRKHWGAFCDADPFDGSDTFPDRMEAAGFVELVPVDDDALEDAFASERGIERGGMMWSLTESGRAALDGGAGA